MEKRNRQDRRSEDRHPIGERILWKPAGSDHFCPGWVSERSSSSVSFVTAADDPLSPNEEIELFGSDRSCGRFRIARTSHYGEHFLVACRREPVEAPA